MIPPRCFFLQFQDLTTPYPWDWGQLQHLAMLRILLRVQGEKNLQRFPQLRSWGVFVPTDCFEKLEKSGNLTGEKQRRYKTIRYKIRYVRSGFEKDTEERTGFEDQWNRPRKLFESLTGSSWFQTRACRHFHPMLGARSLVVTQKQKPQTTTWHAQNQAANGRWIDG